MFFHFDDSNLIRPSEEMAEFVDQLIQRLIEEGLYYDGPDRRSEKRHVVAIPVRAMPLDHNLRPIGPAFMATTRDISRRGIALIHNEILLCPMLAVELADIDGRQIQAAVEVLRCRPVGSYYEIAGTFVTKLYDPCNRLKAAPAAGLFRLLRHAMDRLRGTSSSRLTPHSKAAHRERLKVNTHQVRSLISPLLFDVGSKLT